MSTYQPGLAPQFEQLLRQREAQLREQLRADHPALATSEPSGHDVLDFKDAAAQEAGDQVVQAQSDQAARELTQVLRANERLRQGSYGICLACGERIDLRRLLALPTGSLCAACQQQEEAAAGHAGGRAAT